jgi:hypothetical protein
MGQNERSEGMPFREVLLHGAGGLPEPINQIAELAGIRRVKTAGPHRQANTIGGRRAPRQQCQHERQHERYHRFERHVREIVALQG